MNLCPLCDKETSEPLLIYSDRVMCLDCYGSFKRIWGNNLGKAPTSERVQPGDTMKACGILSPIVQYERKCDYCKRIIDSETSNSIPCISCGHGRLHLRRPKNHCDACGSPIFDNVSPPPVRVTCGHCTWSLISGVRHVEATSGVQLDREIGKKKRKGRKVGTGNQERYKGSKRLFKEVKELAELKTEGDNMAEQLAAIRKAAGLPQRLLADELGLSLSYLSEMEHGRKPLTVGVFRWVKENSPKEPVERDITQ